MSRPIEQLRTRMAELTDLRTASSLLEWDQQTMMPPRGAGSRAESLATLERISHAMFTSPETGKLIEAAAAELDGSFEESDEASLVRVTRRRWEKARRVPTALAADMARASSVGHAAWIAARERSDYHAFAPYLARNLELVRRYIGCFDGFKCAYDVLLDDFEPGMKTRQVAALFDELKAQLLPLIATLTEHPDRVDDACLRGSFPIDRQRQLVCDVVGLMGFDPDSWRIDEAVHPFATGLSSQDVRITTRWNESFLPSALFSAMHECGHGLYEAGIASSLQRSPLGHAESLGIHESQSRMWENMVGRSRAFAGVLAPKIAELFEGPSPGADELFCSVNLVQPSHIRVEADEATYGLHVVLRFELEQALIEGEVSIADLPEAWNARTKEYLGLDVPDDSHGVLQDVHWSGGAIGYFPTYALGNLIAGQLWQRAHVDIPDLDAQIAAGELAGLREWLREHVHRHGAKFTMPELLERVVGEPIAVGPFISYLKDKLSDVYRLDL
jgi:carboxypeptidase Taq